MHVPWLQSKHKHEYGLYKKGVHQKYRDYDLKMEEEQALVASMLASPEEKRYIERAALHERWRAEAGVDSPAAVESTGNMAVQAPLSPQTPRGSVARDCREASTPTPIAIKDERKSTWRRRASWRTLRRLSKRRACVTMKLQKT